MSYGGRPKIGSGHESLNLSMELDILEKLKKIPNKSEFIEKAIAPLLNQLDPGPSCAFLHAVDNIARQELVKAAFQKNYAKVSTIGSMMNSWRDYRLLCVDNRADCEAAGGIWKGDTCTVGDN